MSLRSETTDSMFSLGSSAHPLQKFLKKVVTSAIFDASFGIVILINSVCIGIEQTMQLQGQDTVVINMLDQVFLALYCLELTLRVYVFRLRVFKDHWVKFDAALVCFGIASSWILVPVLGSAEQLGPILVLRTARLLRLVRMVRLLVKFKELWMLTRGLLNSATIMGHTIILLILILYVFGCVGVEVVTKHDLTDTDPEFRNIVEMYFNSTARTMLTLVQFITMDSINAIYAPLIKKDWKLAFYFMSLVMVVSILLLNLITAIVVNKAMEQAHQDNDAMHAYELGKRKALVKQLREIFIRLDDDVSGQVTRAELANITDQDKQLLFGLLGTDDLYVLFDDCDMDGSGAVSIDEFCEGIWKAVSSDVPAEIRRMDKQISRMWSSFKVFEATQAKLTKMMLEAVHDSKHVKKPDGAMCSTKLSPAYTPKEFYPEPELQCTPSTNQQEPVKVSCHGASSDICHNFHTSAVIDHDIHQVHLGMSRSFPAEGEFGDPLATHAELGVYAKLKDQNSGTQTNLQGVCGLLYHQQGLQELSTRRCEVQGNSPIDAATEHRVSRTPVSVSVNEVHINAESIRSTKATTVNDVKGSGAPVSLQSSSKFESTWCAEDFLVRDVNTESPVPPVQVGAGG